MTPLRQSMIDAMRCDAMRCDAMRLRGFAVRTQRSYLDAMTKLSQYYRRSPDTLTHSELQAYFLYLVKERHLSPASCRLYLNGIRFFYQSVLGWESLDVELVVPKRVQRIPELLSRAEVSRILSSPDNPKHRVLLATCYGCGLRVSELVGLGVDSIDGERRLLRIVQGKGAKDRQVVVSASLLRRLREYWHLYRPETWLFPAQGAQRALSITSAQRVFGRAKRRAGIDKVGGIHSLRHAYATHQLDAGMPVHQLQRLLGHSNLQSTMRYVHWVPRYQQGEGGCDLLAGLESV